jgi:lipid-A-disaccharide synthase
MRYYVIAGELSGDLHAAYLVRELKKRDTHSEFRGFGGEALKTEGCTLVRHINDLAFMGFVEVVANIVKVLDNIKTCKRDIVAWQPDCVILVDYPGFNLRIAKFVRKLGNIKVFYYISPTVWAWRKGRIQTMKKTIDNLYVILPFEQRFYRENGWTAQYFGHPLLDEISDYRKTAIPISESHKLQNEKPLVVLMPGSRTQEIRKMLPLQLRLAGKYPQFRFAIAAVSSHSKEFYRCFVKSADVEICFNQTYSLLNNATAALVCSGTATLETALFGIPQVVCYKANVLSWLIGRWVANVRYISLVNLILDKASVCELLQNNCTDEALEKEFCRIVFDRQHIDNMMSDYNLLSYLLGNAGASSVIAEDMIGRL